MSKTANAIAFAAIIIILVILAPVAIRTYGWWWAFVLEGVCS